MQKNPFDISLICSVLGLPYGKLYRWLKERITSFKDEKTQEELHKNDLSKNTPNQVLVPIFRPKNIGECMAIDEKFFNGKFHTVLSNAKTGKVALLCSTIKEKEITQCIKKFGVQTDKVQLVTRDLSSTFKKVCDINFQKAKQIADKFHVIRHGIEAVQNIRIRLKQEVLKQQYEEQQQFKKHQRDNANEQFIGPKLKLPKTYKPDKIENGETLAELLTRSRYLCAKSAEKWNQYQYDRTNLLFKYFPELEVAYSKIIEFGDWYNPKTKVFEPFWNEKELGNSIDHLNDTNINELKVFSNLLENHFTEILNYHRCGNKTNAFAESINAKISNANRKNKGTRDIDYFNFRLSLII